MRILYIFFALLLFSSFAAAKTVTFNLNFNISSNDLIRANATFYNKSTLNNVVFTNDHISSENGVSVLGFASAGDLINIQFVNMSQTNLFQMRQNENNRLIITFTKGNWSDVTTKMPSINEFKIPPKTFGNFALTSTNNFVLFIVAEFLSNNLNSMRLSSGNNRIKINEYGKTENRNNLNITTVR